MSRIIWGDVGAWGLGSQFGLVSNNGKSTGKEHEKSR